ncbi:PREDICTED: putative clathrin assembly protein At4g40080 [Theobroma cacao]|uniref:Clathrin assembly protein At4g40080 n=2 Tax=Theobroma cacao TaxID=3641 RepID=A0AB32VS40_THECC|nr:PREDICTED: putative clathrin assembly protein At4g40080 [Theobroma cacao]EOX91988.1 ENTH/ANTH/VHS superfamily protein, putative [Theobroma cacao]
MGRVTILRDLIGIIKDKASQSKAALLSNPKTLSLHLALLRATTHDPFTPPDPRHLAALLSFGHSSRAIAATAIEALMDRLQTTRDASVAIKCLFTIHHIIKRGSFILQDQLSVFPATGGRNYLKLSNFRDNTTPLTWELSSWVRWYALYLESLLSTSRILGFFLCSTSSSVDIDKEEEKVSSLINSELLREINSLVNLLEQISKSPNSLHANGNILVEEIQGLVGEDYLSSINEVSIRVGEVRERLSSLSFVDSVEWVCALKRLEDCKERSLALSQRKKVLIDAVWGSISEIKDQVGSSKVYREEGRLLTMGSRNKASESARFGERVLKHGDSVKFSSGRFLRSNNLSFRSYESVESYA